MISRDAPSRAEITQAEAATEALIRAVAQCRQVAREDHKAANHFVGVWSDQRLRLDFAMLDALYGPSADPLGKQEKAA